MIYALHNSNSRERLGLNSSILKTTKEYHRPIPIDYLARLYGRTREEIQPYLDNLEEAGLITIVVKGKQQYIKHK